MNAKMQPVDVMAKERLPQLPAVGLLPLIQLGLGTPVFLLSQTVGD